MVTTTPSVQGSRAGANEAGGPYDSRGRLVGLGRPCGHPDMIAIPRPAKMPPLKTGGHTHWDRPARLMDQAAGSRRECVQATRAARPLPLGSI
jgi:hypothetical protein